MNPPQTCTCAVRCDIEWQAAASLCLAPRHGYLAWILLIIMVLWRFCVSAETRDLESHVTTRGG